jgi:hypothetical protein
VPRSLAAPTRVAGKQLSGDLEKSVLKLKGSQDFARGGDPAQVTDALLKSHRDANLDATSGQLTLPAIDAAALAAATTLQGLADLLMDRLGVSKVRLNNPDGKSLEITVGINPDVQLGMLEPQGLPKSKEDLQRMAQTARGVSSQNDAALKAQMMTSPSKINRVIVGSGFAAVATYVTLPPAERSGTIGIGFAEPWSLRADLLMGQTAEYLQVAGFPNFEDYNWVNRGGYLPSSVFADVTALQRAESGMAVFPGWAGPSEQYDATIHAAGATPGAAQQITLNQSPQAADDPRTQQAQQQQQQLEQQQAQDKRIKPVANADEHIAQRGKAKGKTLIIGAGASSAWNVEQVKSRGGDFAWLARAAPVVDGTNPQQPRGQILQRESYLLATGGGSRNDGNFDWSRMYVGEASSVAVAQPTPDPASRPPTGAAGSNPEPPQRSEAQKKSPWEAPADYQVRVPINTGSSTVLLYTKALDLAGGPGPARKLNTGDPGQAVGDPMSGGRRGAVQMTAQSAAQGDQLADPDNISIQVSASGPGDRGDGLPTLPGGTFGQVVYAIGSDAGAPGGVDQLITRNNITTTIIWDRAMSDPATQWPGNAATGIPPASALGVENKQFQIRVLGAAAASGPGLKGPDQTLYRDARNAQLGRIGDPGGRAEAGISRVGGTFAAANAQVGGGAPQALPNAGRLDAPVPSGGDAAGTQRQPAQAVDPNFTPIVQQDPAQRAQQFADRMQGYISQGLDRPTLMMRWRMFVDSVGELWTQIQNHPAVVRIKNLLGL